MIGTDGPAVVLSARTAAWLERHAGLTSLRVRVRGTDPAISRELEEVRRAGMLWCASATGSPVAPEPELAAPSKQWLSTGQVAELLNVTDRAVRLACASGRLEAVQVAGRYRITREAIAHYRAARAA
jgi:excisionase family DNA binding protein